MQAPNTQLKPLDKASLSADESKIVAWLKTTSWIPQTGVSGPVPHKTKVPEFFSGVRLYRLQAGSVQSGAGAMGALDLFIKKMQFQGVISKQNLYPVATEGPQRFLYLTKADLENLGVRFGGGRQDEDDDE